MIVQAARLGLNYIQKSYTIQNGWSTRLAFSDVFIDRFSFDDQVVVTGKIRNISNRNLEGVVVRAYVLNVVSQQIGEEYLFIQPDILLPEAGSEFSIRIPCKVNLVHKVRVEIYDAREQIEIKRPIKLSEVFAQRAG